jgi:hypothetical protein
MVDRAEAAGGEPIVGDHEGAGLRRSQVIQAPAGLPGADVSRLPAWLTVQHDACHRSIIVKYQIITPSGGDGGG